MALQGGNIYIYVHVYSQAARSRKSTATEDKAEKGLVYDVHIHCCQIWSFVLSRLPGDKVLHPSVCAATLLPGPRPLHLQAHCFIFQDTNPVVLDTP